MVSGRCVGLVGLALAVGAPVVAQGPDPIATAVRNLGHPRYAEREEAARTLEAIGEPALPALRQAARAGDEEVRTRAATVAERIDRAVRSERLLTAPTLSLKFDRTPLAQAVSEFAAKSRLRVNLDSPTTRPPDRTVTLDTGDLPYWQAVHEFYRAAGLTEALTPPAHVRPNSPTRRLGSYSGPVQTTAPVTWLIDGPAAAPADLRRAFRVRAVPAADRKPERPPGSDEVTLFLDIDPAPGLVVREVIGVEVRKAVAADGRALAAAYPPDEAVAALGFPGRVIGNRVVIVNGDLVMDDGVPANEHHSVTLKTGGKPVRELAELHGVVVARVLTPAEPVLTVPHVARRGTREVVAGGTVVQIKDVSAPIGDRVVIQVVLTTRGDATEDVLNLPVRVKGQVRQFIRINRDRRAAAGAPDLRLVNPAGDRVPGLSLQTTATMFDGTTTTRNLSLIFDKPAKGLEDLCLVLMARRPVLVEMPFVLKDVPLP